MKKSVYIISAITVILLLFPAVGCRIKAENIAELVIGTVEKASEESIEKTAEEGTAQDENITEDKNTVESEEITGQADYSNDFSLQDTKGNTVSLSDYQGELMVLNFWATWCPPCVDEIPYFIEVYNQYNDRDVQFIGVSLDSDINALNQFVIENNMNYPILIDDQNIADEWNIEFIPTTFIMDGNGNILTERIGQIPRVDLVDLIEDNI